jgi:hypothetical protein
LVALDGRGKPGHGESGAISGWDVKAPYTIGQFADGEANRVRGISNFTNTIRVLLVTIRRMGQFNRRQSSGTPFVLPDVQPSDLQSVFLKAYMDVAPIHDGLRNPP